MAIGQGHSPQVLFSRLLTVHGDIGGWREAVVAGAKAGDLLLARIDGDQFVIFDGRSIPFSECKLEFS